MKSRPSTDTEKAMSVMFEIGRIIRQACIKSDGASLPLSHMETLRFIAEKKTPTMRDVAAYLRITAPSATAIIEELSRASLILREEDARDRRLVRLSISRKGKKILLSTMKSRSNALRAILAGLSSSDRQELIRIFSKLTSHG